MRSQQQASGRGRVRRLFPVRTLLALLLALALRSAAAAAIARPSAPPLATTYYFSTSGSDANDGLSEATPKLSLSLMASLLQPGVTIRLKRGDTFYVPGIALRFTALGNATSAPMTIGAYGDAALPRPTIADLVPYPTANWRVDGNDTYSLPQSNGRADLDFVYRLYLGGEPLAKVPNQASLVDHTYCVDTGRIYVKDAAFLAHPVVETIEHADGYFFDVADVHQLTFEQLVLKGGDGGGAAGTALRFSAPSTNLTLRDVELRQFRGYGMTFGVTSWSDTTSRHRDVTIERCTIDKGWSAAMNAEYAHVVAGLYWNGANGGGPGGDAILFADAVDGGLVRDCTITNMGHSGVGGQIGTPALFGLRRIVVETSRVTRGTSSYCRAFAFGGSAAQCRGIVVRRNHFRDLTNASHLGGSRCSVYSNVFDLTTVTTSTSHQQPWCIDAMLGLNYGGSGIDYVMEECVVANNTFVDADAFVWYQWPAGSSQLLDRNVFANNLFVGWRNTSISYDAALVMHWTYEPFMGFVRNGFWGGAPNRVVFFDNLGRHDVDALNGIAPSRGNLEADPEFVGGAPGTPEHFRLASTSPFADAGVDLAALLPAGLDAVDFYGRPFPPHPSLGAIQVGRASGGIRSRK